MTAPLPSILVAQPVDVEQLGRSQAIRASLGLVLPEDTLLSMLNVVLETALQKMLPISIGRHMVFANL
jgi:hypothetical protein